MGVIEPVIDKAAPKPVGFLAYNVGIAVGLLAVSADAVLAAIHKGDPNTPFLLMALVMGYPFFWLYTAFVGWLPFHVLRKLTPAGRLSRLLFLLLILVPIVCTVVLVVTVWLDGFIDSTPYFHVSQPPFADRLAASATKDWHATLFTDFCVGLAGWAVDQRSSLFSDDRTVRRTARFTLWASITAIVLPIVFFVACNQYVVAYRAESVAGARPYCILIPTYDNRMYAVPTSLWQLSPFTMRASYLTPSGSMGGIYVTNHALLVLDNPREYLNWSYWSESFVLERLIDLSYHHKAERAQAFFKPCTPEPNFVASIHKHQTDTN